MFELKVLKIIYFSRGTASRNCQQAKRENIQSHLEHHFYHHFLQDYKLIATHLSFKWLLQVYFEMIFELYTTPIIQKARKHRSDSNLYVEKTFSLIEVSKEQTPKIKNKKVLKFFVQKQHRKCKIYIYYYREPKLGLNDS